MGMNKGGDDEGIGGGVEVLGNDRGLFRRPTGIVNLLVVGLEVAPPVRSMSSS